MNDTTIVKELLDIKKLLIVQLILDGVSIRDIVKITGMSTATLYKFLPKDLEKKKDSK